MTKEELIRSANDRYHFKYVGQNESEWHFGVGYEDEYCDFAIFKSSYNLKVITTLDWYTLKEITSFIEELKSYD